jgi:hypothetical protein
VGVVGSLDAVQKLRYGSRTQSVDGFLTSTDGLGSRTLEVSMGCDVSLQDFGLGLDGLPLAEGKRDGQDTNNAVAIDNRR